jgi:hypothetical protein
LSQTVFDTIPLSFENTSGALTGETDELGVVVCKVDPNPSWNNCNPYTNNTTYFDGSKEWKLKFKVPNEYENFRILIGLAKDSASENGLNDIEYAFYLTANNGVLDLYESGTRAQGFLQHQNVIEFDPDRDYTIHFDGDSVRYIIDDTLLFSSAKIPSGNYKIKLSLHYNDPCVSNILLLKENLQNEAVEALKLLNGLELVGPNQFTAIKNKIISTFGGFD